MVTRRSLSALAPVEQYANSTKCLSRGPRVCRFHASPRRRVDESSSEAEQNRNTSAQAPKRGLTRQERAAVISDEIKMIQRDHPSPSFADQNPNIAVDKPSPFVQDVAAGTDRMGENQSLGKESLNTGRGLEVEYRPSQTTSAMVLPDKPSEQETQTQKEAGEAASKADLRDEVQRKLYQQAHGTSTLACKNPWLILHDRLRTMTERRQSQKPYLRRVTNLPKEASGKNSHTIPSNIGIALIAKQIRGEYDADGILQGNAPYRQAVLNDVAKTLTMNPTYLKGDRDRLVKKVQSLLPATVQSRQKETTN